jgi:peptidoglycan hydrolase-like protein with peptidoglycan-binding domain
VSSTYVVPGADAPKEDLAASGRWGESIARSRSRRRAAARQRRRSFRSRGALVAVAGALVLSAGGAGVASADSSYLTVGSEGDQVSAVEQALGLPADGYFDEGTARAVRNFQAENGLTVDGIVGPETSGALGLSSGGASSESTSSSGGSASTDASAALEQIAQCESGGDPTAVSADGQYRGKYQFSMETWQAMGGSGDPAAAPEAEQDRIAAELYAQSGASPWPNCG